MRPRGTRFSNWLTPRPKHRQHPALRKGQRIGLLGGSFNPAHEGHLHISLEALKRLDLHQVWWLVAPQNPLKNTTETAPYEKRLTQAAELARHPRIKVSDLEQRWNCRYTIDTVRLLQQRFSEHTFVWLMGADAFASLHDWRGWTQIVSRMPLAVLNRPGFMHLACGSKAATRLDAFRYPESVAAALATMAPPCWSFIDVPLRDESSTALRVKKNR